MNTPLDQTVFISLYLDVRRQNKKGLFPVKLRVFTKSPRKQKLYPTVFEMKEKDFQSTWNTIKPRTEFKELREQLQAVLSRAEKTAANLPVFNFKDFEKKLFSRMDESQNVLHHYEILILKQRENKQFGTASNYELACNSLKAFFKSRTGREPKTLLFSDFTSEILDKYENWMTEEKKRSQTTVSMYLRTLRTVFNTAIDSGDIEKELYPFGRRKYQVPAARNIKKALSKDVLRTLFEAIPKTMEQERAKDVFFFSYACNGMNIKDIAGLKYENIKGDTLQFNRAKTLYSSKGNQKPNVVYLTEYTKGIIQKYGSDNPSLENYIFPFLSKESNDYENFRKVKNLTISVNHSIKKLAKAAGITENISSYAARHSFATNAIRNGASMEFISEALSHSNLKTTQQYFAGFEEETKREISESLMKF